jgi:hypothetical protein
MHSTQCHRNTAMEQSNHSSRFNGRGLASQKRCRPRTAKAFACLQGRDSCTRSAQSRVTHAQIEIFFVPRQSVKNNYRRMRTCSGRLVNDTIHLYPVTWNAQYSQTRRMCHVDGRFSKNRCGNRLGCHNALHNDDETYHNVCTHVSHFRNSRS